MHQNTGAVSSLVKNLLGNKPDFDSQSFLSFTTKPDEPVSGPGAKPLLLVPGASKFQQSTNTQRSKPHNNQ